MAKWYVNSAGNDKNPGTGPEPTLAWQTIQYGVDHLAAGGNGGQLWVVAQGEYKEHVRMEGSQYSKITIAGCDTKGVPLPNPPTGNPLDTEFCERRPVVDGSKSGPVFTIKDAPEVTLKDLFITNGDGPMSGGGIRARSSNKLMVNRCCIVSNHSKVDGGGFSLDDCDKSTVSECLIVDNSADEDGAGGLLKNIDTASVVKNRFFGNTAKKNGGGLGIVECSDVTVDQCTFGGPLNSTLSIAGKSLAPANSAEQGACIYVSENKASLKIGLPGGDNGNLFEGNTATLAGGAVAIMDASMGVTLTNNKVIDNSAETKYVANVGRGGAVFIEQFTEKNPAKPSTNTKSYVVKFVDNKITACTAPYRGGGIYAAYSSHVELSGANKITRCWAQSGGAIFGWFGCDVTLNADTDIHLNWATDSDGAGICLFNSSLLCAHATITHNQAAQGAGGGIAVRLVKASEEHVFYPLTDDYNAEIKLADRTLMFHNSADKTGGLSVIESRDKPNVIVVIEDCRFEQNTGKSLGGGFHFRNVPEYEIKLSMFDKNNCDKQGGGGYIETSGNTKRAVKDNYIGGFVENKAARGPALAFEDSPIDKDTITGNRFTDNQFTTKKVDSAILLKKCILANNVTEASIGDANSMDIPGTHLPSSQVIIEK